jgi:hypothetical protein
MEWNVDHLGLYVHATTAFTFWAFWQHRVLELSEGLYGSICRPQSQKCPRVRYARESEMMAVVLWKGKAVCTSVGGCDADMNLLRVAVA